MNHRISELLEQARMECMLVEGSKPATTVGYDELEKFAKLIVKECTEILRNTFDCQYEAEQIEEHFGVK